MATCSEVREMRPAYLLHQVSRRIVDESQVLVTETLNVRGMTRNRCLARTIADALGGAAQADHLQGAVGATDPHRGGSVVLKHPTLQRVPCGA